MAEDSILKGTRIDLKHEEKVIKPEEIHHIHKPGELGAELELIVSDPKTGKVTEHRIMKSHSFVRQFLEMLFIKMAESPFSATIPMRDTTNNLRNAYLETLVGPYIFDVNAAATVVTYGIVIGTGAVAPTIDDFQLGNQIAHATMNYSAHAFGTPGANATTSQLTITRNFTNVSGGAITVNEIGLYSRGYDGSIRYFMLIRDVIAGGIAVPNGQTLTVNYRPQAVV